MNPKAEDNFIVPLRHEDDAPRGQPAETGPDEAILAPQSDSLEDVRLAAGTHHVGYLTAIERDLEDKEIAAAALGAFDGTVQAFDMKLSDLDMHTNGAAFIVAQLTNLERIGDVDPDWIAEITEEAMTSSALEAIRDEAGRFCLYGGRGHAVRLQPADALGGDANIKLLNGFLLLCQRVPALVVELLCDALALVAHDLLIQRF